MYQTVRDVAQTASRDIEVFICECARKSDDLISEAKNFLHILLRATFFRCRFPNKFFKYAYRLLDDGVTLATHGFKRLTGVSHSFVPRLTAEGLCQCRESSSRVEC